MINTQGSAPSRLARIMKEFGWVGLIVTFLVSDFGFSAFVNFFKDAFSGGDASLESAITILTVFIQTLGLSLGVLVCTVVQLRVRTFHFPNTLIIYTIILVVAGYLAHALGIGQNIEIPTSDWRELLPHILSFYLNLYGIFLFAASIIIGVFIGRWFHLLSENN